MNQPPDFLMPILHSIEKTVILLTEEFPRMADKDVEWAYENLKAYFQKRGRGKDAEEPEHSSETKTAISDEILNILEIREEDGLDDEYVDNEFYSGHPTVYHLYAKSFNHLQRSARFWRKENGPKGYIRFIKGSGMVL